MLKGILNPTHLLAVSRTKMRAIVNSSSSTIADFPKQQICFIRNIGNVVSVALKSMQTL